MGLFGIKQAKSYPGIEDPMFVVNTKMVDPPFYEGITYSSGHIQLTLQIKVPDIDVNRNEWHAHVLKQLDMATAEFMSRKECQ